MNLNFKNLLSSVLGKGHKAVDDLQGEKGLIAKSVTTGYSNRQYERSLRARSENFILQFPIVVTDSLSTDTVEVVRNQVELERAVDIHTVLNNTPVVNMAGSNGYLDSYHQNVYMTNNSPLSLKAGATVGAFTEASNELLSPADSLLEDKSLNTQTLPVELMELSEAQTVNLKDGSSMSLDGDVEVSSKPLEVSNAPIKGNAKKFERLNRTTPLLSKSNVTYAIKDPNDGGKIKGTLETKEITFGVKAVVHGVAGQDAVYFLGDSSKRSNTLARLIRLTTGEIGFFREFLLNADRSRKLATAKQSKIWNVMNSMFTVEKMNQYQKKHGGLIPTITLAVSIDEIEQIRINTGIDILTNGRAAAKIYDELFLLDFYIIDEANQLAHKYMPRERSFDTLTLSAMSGRDLNDRNKAKNSAEDLLKRLLGKK